ncbi:cell division cycle-associated protein 2 isoform X3 [Betta splendens]|uniref:Cell division cycle-associated protein 2 isoform X3 n=1 Tax=Betta splendens TaxID=158456 RepID=A0A6P7NNB2_BETSP|nr:cell division cycle-associated protein 2 isoform X3 [Betta splendens]
MATTEMNTPAMPGEQRENTLTLSEEDASPVLNDSAAPLNFSELTPGQFGISAQSFIPSSSNHKSKSRLAQIKARRRSSIGVRGSPETNSLIRFIAQQRMKTPPAQQTSEHVKSSPFLPRVTSTLRQKMASFQSLMDVEETGVCDQMPRQDSDGGGCIKTRDYVPESNSLNRGKENDPPVVTLTPSKRRRLGPLEGCEVEIREDSGFEPQSPTQTPSDDPAAISPTQLGSPFHISSLPSLLEMEPKAKNDTSVTCAVKKKKVHFGGPLSPELFDKNLPPSTPLQKGATPARAPTPGGALRSVLKTPQRNESLTPPAQPDFSNPAVSGASPVLAMSRYSKIMSVETDNKDEDKKIVFPLMEETDCPATSCAEVLEAQPLNLYHAFHGESPSEKVTESETKQMDLLDELASSPDKGKEPQAPVQSRKQSKELPGPQCGSTSVAPVRSSSRKRKPKESGPMKRSTRSAAMSASKKIKITSTATHRWNKDVDHSLYGSRKFASKNPSLSPITESLSFLSQSSAALQTSSAAFTEVMDQETCLNPEIVEATQAVEEHTVTNSLKHPQGSGTFSYSSKESTTRKGRRLSGPTVTGRRLKKRNVSVSDCDVLNKEPQNQPGGDPEEPHNMQTTTTPKALNKIPLESAVPDKEGVEIEPNSQISTDPPSIASDSTLPRPCLLSGDELRYTLNEESAQEKQVRRSSKNSPKLQEEGDKAAEQLVNCSVEENASGEEASSQIESRSSSDNQEDETFTNVHLAPWQADFNFEDVFKPVSTRGQRSVRRSLRNQRNSGHSNNSAGLAWVPRVSPVSSKDPRRKTRGRRLSAALAVQPSLEESLNNMW